MRNKTERFERAKGALPIPLIVVMIFVASLVIVLASVMTSAFGAIQRDKPTVVMVHGALAGSSSWTALRRDSSPMAIRSLRSRTR